MSATMFEIAKVRFEDIEEIYHHKSMLNLFKLGGEQARTDALFILHLHEKILSWINNRNHRFPNYIDELATEYDRCQVCQSNVDLNRFMITDDDGDEEDTTVPLHNVSFDRTHNWGRRIDTIGNLENVCHACLSCSDLVSDDNEGVTHYHISINSHNVEGVGIVFVNEITVSAEQHPQKQYFITHLGIYNRICLIESSLDDDDEIKTKFHETEEQKYSYYVDGFDNFGDTPYFIEKKFVHQYFTMRQIKNEAETDFVNVFNPSYILK